MDGVRFPLITVSRRVIIPEVLPARMPLWRRRPEVPGAGCLRRATHYEEPVMQDSTVGVFLDVYG